MESTPQFRSDLYQGTADYYARYRVPYPAELMEDLVIRAGLSGTGRLLDLACGPGRVTFALADHFADVLAVDQEEESAIYGRARASERGITHIRWQSARAEDLDVAGTFELVTVGDGFHRLDRRRVAVLATEWLQPGGHIALLWTSMPWQGPAPWQEAAMELVVHWMEITGSLDNIPSNLAESLTSAPNLTVLADAGLNVVGTYDFQSPHTWTPETLAGFAYSTSILSQSALDDQVDAFERDLQDRLLSVQPDGNFEESVSFSYDLAVKQ
jgi:ubiquinone/menaquinone biosynthesis C-methylase UbiE